MNLIQIIIILSLTSFMVVGLLVKHSSMVSYAEFTMKQGKLNWFTIACGISMTFAGGGAILSTASVGYTFKWFSLVDPISLMIGLVISVLFYKKYLHDKGVTISDLLSSNHKGLNVLVGLVTTIAFLLILAAQFVALSKLLSPYFPSIHPLWMTFIVSTCIFGYVFFGGFNSVTKTDILQFVLISLFLVVPMIFFVATRATNGASGESPHDYIVMPLDYVILFAIPIFFTPLSQDVNLRVKSAKSITEGKIGLLMGGIFYFSIAFSAAYVGIYMGNHGVKLQDPELAIPMFFKEHFPAGGIFAVIAILSAIVSSLDSYSLNSITSISNDIIKHLSNNKENVKRNIKIASLVTYALAMSVALFFNKVLALSLTSLLIYISVLLPVAFANAIHLNSKKTFVVTVVIILIIVFCEVLSMPVSPKALVYPLMGCVLILVFKLFDYARN